MIVKDNNLKIMKLFFENPEKSFTSGGSKITRELPAKFYEDLLKLVRKYEF